MPAFLLVMTMMISDRATGTSLFVASMGGSGWLYENIFWIMGHPEVYVILLPPVAATRPENNCANAAFWLPENTTLISIFFANRCA